MHKLYKSFLFFCILILIHSVGFAIQELLSIRSLTDFKDFLILPLVVSIITYLAHIFTSSIKKASIITSILFIIIFGTLSTIELINPSNSLYSGWDYFIKGISPAFCSFFVSINKLIDSLSKSIYWYWITSIYLTNVIGLSLYFYIVGNITEKVYFKFKKRFTTQV